MTRLDDTNAKDELIEAVEGRTVAYGRVAKPPEVDVSFSNHDEYLAALPQLDLVYDSGYGDQELFGVVIFTDGSWLERGEYDGKEWWELKSIPTREEVAANRPDEGA